MLRLFTAFALLLFGNSIFGQELTVDVSVNTPKLQTVDPKVFQTLEGDLRDFLSSQKWTEDNFEPEERINMNVQLTINSEISPTNFTAELTIQVTRPVFGSNYETATVNYRDKDIAFEYEQFQPIEYSITTFNDNLSSLFSFYVYIALGMDYDTFSPYGGEEYFQLAQNILNNIPANVANSKKGWRALDGNRNRYWMIENLLNPGLRSFRKGMYDYHRLGLDEMHTEPEKARAIILKTLEDIQLANKKYPNSQIIQMFVNSKGEELVSIFSSATSAEKQRVKAVLAKIDPSKASRYNRRLGN